MWRTAPDSRNMGMHECVHAHTHLDPLDWFPEQSKEELSSLSSLVESELSSKPGSSLQAETYLGKENRIHGTFKPPSFRNTTALN